MDKLWFLTLILLLLPVSACCAMKSDSTQADWLEHFKFVQPSADPSGLRAEGKSELPSFSVTPAASGRQIVRVSLPFTPGALPAEMAVAVRAGGKEVQPDIRPVTFNPGRPVTVRRAILTFAWDFPDTTERQFALALKQRENRKLQVSGDAGEFSGFVGNIEVRVSASSVRVLRDNKNIFHAELIAPARTSVVSPKVEVVEQGRQYLWVRVLAPDERWPRIIEVRADSLGSVGVRGHLQRLDDKDGYAPDLGWKISGDKDRITFPDFPVLKRGSIAPSSDGVTYLRCKSDERVPMQMAAWREAEFVFAPSGVAPWNAMLEPPHKVDIPAKYFDAIYGCGIAPDLSPWKDLAGVAKFHRDAIVESTPFGDDYGNIIGYPRSKLGWNRLNHCPAIFEDYYRSGDIRLRESAVGWCNNFYDLTVWWGTDKEGQFGGTRYHYSAKVQEEHKGDKEFTWRSNDAVCFCTKGIDSFFYAYEETGDPRMAAALRWQVDYSNRMVHAGLNYTRDIGEVASYTRLYRFTGDKAYLAQARRLFSELRGCLSDGDLFTESGKPIDKDPPFIDDDKLGYDHPFAKPYIIGYALQGLPDLASMCPDEPKLHDVVRAVADFLARTEDPVGGWRYPHPKSRIIYASQGIEHAAQMMRAAKYLESRGEPIANLLDGIECVLQSRILVWRKTGQIFGGLSGWEKLKEGQSIYDLYKKPDDRDPTRDYIEGPISMNWSAPEGIVYFNEILDFYLKHRPAERLFNASPKMEILLGRMKQARAEVAPTADYLRCGVAEMLPTFNDAQVKRLTYPLAYDPTKWLDKWLKNK